MSRSELRITTEQSEMSKWGVVRVPEEQRIPIVVKKDMVEVVRCKECKYYTDKLSLSTVTHGSIPKLCIVLERYLHENDYCSYGEKKDG